MPALSAVVVLLVAPVRAMVAPPPDVTTPLMLHNVGGAAATLTVPGVVVTGMGAEPASVAMALESSRLALAVALGDIVTAAVAMTPLGIVVAFTPNRMQSTQPSLFTQVRVLPAAVVAGLAARVTDVIVDSG